MTIGELIFILIVNFVVLLTIVIFIIRYVSERFKERIDDTGDKIKDTDERCKIIEGKIEKIEYHMSKYGDHNVQAKNPMNKDFEKMKLVVQDIGKKTDKIYKRTEKLYNKR